MQSSQWQYAGASAQAWFDGGLAVFRTTGVVTPTVCGLVLGDCQVAMQGWGADGLVAQYTGADLKIDAKALLQSALSVVATDGALALPAALLVKPDDAEMWRSYAWLMARNGIVRGVFTDADEAMRWARLQAAIFSSDRRQRLALEQ